MSAAPARLPGASPGPALLARLRDRLLDQVLGLLEADPAVAGVALVGIAKDLSSPSPGQLGDAVASYLDLVEATVQPGEGRAS